MKKLKENYKDDVFSGNRKYRVITNSDGTASFEDATNYQVQGDSFGAEDLNAITSAINETKKTITLNHENWVGKVYTISDSLITATSTHYIDPVQLNNPPSTQDIVYIEALQEANIVGCGQSIGKLYLYALGTVPKVNLNISVTFKK